MKERYIKWYTPYLSREFEMLIFGEKGGLDDGRWRGQDWNYCQDMLPYYLSIAV